MQNPEYYTVWNYRRLVMRHLFADSGLVPAFGLDETRSVEGITQLISNDLGFLFPLLRKFPKCYWIWNYRLWLLEQASSLLPADTSLQFWLRELSLVGKMLTLDSRNFLGWGYRRTVVAALESSPKKPTKEPPQSMAEQEFQYTTRMIEANLSNFSAWHSRSKLIPRLLNEQEADATARQEFLDSGTLPATVAPFMLSHV
jgi:geranylgeranyl transferase type-2 subunit alpha